MRLITFITVSLLMSAAACVKPEPHRMRVSGMKPVYVSEQDFYDIRNKEQQPLKNTGTIYIWQQYFLVIEYRYGIHVYDRSDPSLPTYVTFLSIPGASDFTIAGHTLFADNSFDILSIDIQDLRNIKLNTVLKGATRHYSDKPPGYNGYFECYDPAKGHYTGWAPAELSDPQCRTLTF